MHYMGASPCDAYAILFMYIHSNAMLIIISKDIATCRLPGTFDHSMGPSTLRYSLNGHLDNRGMAKVPFPDLSAGSTIVVGHTPGAYNSTSQVAHAATWEVGPFCLWDKALNSEDAFAVYMRGPAYTGQYYCKDDYRLGQGHYSKLTEAAKVGTPLSVLRSLHAGAVPHAPTPAGNLPDRVSFIIWKASPLTNAAFVTTASDNR